MRTFKWTPRREQAAILVAEGRLNHRDIAKQLGINKATLRSWNLSLEFQARVAFHLDAMTQAVRERGIANREHRLQAMNDRWQRLMGFIEARAQEMADVPGGDSGLLTKKMKRVKVQVSVDELGGAGLSKPSGSGRGGSIPRSGKRVVEVAHYSVDLGLLREMREMEKQVAIEMGEWDQREGPAQLWPMLAAALKVLQLEGPRPALLPPAEEEPIEGVGE